MAKDPLARARVPAALFAATLLLTTGIAAMGTHDGAWGGTVPRVSVEGGALLEAVLGRVTVVATAPECTVRLSTPAGGEAPRPFRLEVRNAGADTRVTGLAGGEDYPRGASAVRVELDPANGWPRNVTCRLPQPAASINWSFIAMGDPQGHDWNVQVAGELAEATGARFVLLLGDLTASGQAGQYASLAAAIGRVAVPVYAVPGNHDMMNMGRARFLREFGAAQGAFDYGGVRFVLLDTSSQAFSERDASALLQMAAGRPAGERLVVATHTPPRSAAGDGYDPFLDSGASARLAAAVETAGADLMLAGHVHMYCSTATAGGVPLVVTGGGGGVLEPEWSSWSFHHLVRVDVGPSAITWTPIPLSDERPGGEQGPRVQVVPRRGPVLTLTLDELLPLATVEGTWSFEDRLGNWEGQGRYTGVPMSSIVGLVGGMPPGGRLEVGASDGYAQLYSRSNVFPDDGARALQGQMVLAISLDGATPPRWDAGPRIIFTPPDGRYSNADAEATTDPGMQADPFSAGTRWVREVATIEFLGG